MYRYIQDNSIASYALARRVYMCLSLRLQHGAQQPECTNTINLEEGWWMEAVSKA